MLKILIIVLITNGFVFGIPTPETSETNESDTMVCSTDRCCGGPKTGDEVKNDNEEIFEDDPDHCSFSKEVDPNGIHLVKRYM